jgi:hypothetical protein
MSTAHTYSIIDKYLSKLDLIFNDIKRFENGEDVFNYLHSLSASESFSRLN